MGEGEKQLAGGHHTGSTPPMESLETQPYNSQPYNFPLVRYNCQPYNSPLILQLSTFKLLLTLKLSIYQQSNT